jgi:hypothetical protein
MDEKPQERPAPAIDTVRKELAERDDEIESAELDEEDNEEEEEEEEEKE